MIRLLGLARRHLGWLAPLSVLGLIGFSIACGAIGIDFGWHWDEHYHVEGVRECVDGLTLSTHRYIYGSVYFLLGLLVVAAHHVRFLPEFFLEMARKSDGAIIDLAGYDSVKRFHESAHGLLASNRYVLETRMVFFCVSSLAALWVYLTVRKLYPGRYLGALGAAAFAALCWELHYHGRFIAVDAVMAQLMAAALYLLSGAWTSTRVPSFLGFYVGAAIVSGVLFTCKATGLVAILPVLLLPFVLPARPPLGLALGLSPGLSRRRWGLAALAALVSATTVLVVQPGTAADFLRYVAALRREAWEYGFVSANNGNVVPSVVGRIAAFFAWLGLAVPSHHVVGSALLSAVVVVGVVCFVRDRPRLSVLGGVVVLVMFVMMVRHPLFFVRQYLMLIPFMALGFGAGLTALHERFGARWRWLSRSTLVVTAVVLVLNARWLHATARSIRHDSPGRGLQDLTADLLARPEPVRVSPSLVSDLSGPLSPRYRCRAPGPDVQAQVPIALRASDGVWRTNKFGLASRSYGARWINFDWYPPGGAGSGPSPIYVLSPRQIRAQGIPVDKYEICEPAR